MSKETSTSGGIGFFGMLTIVFILLKLAGIGAVANWSWWWVLSPLWIGWALLFGVAAISFVFYVIVKLFERK